MTANASLQITFLVIFTLKQQSRDFIITPKYSINAYLKRTIALKTILKKLQNRTGIFVAPLDSFLQVIARLINIPGLAFAMH